LQGVRGPQRLREGSGVRAEAVAYVLLAQKRLAPCALQMAEAMAKATAEKEQAVVEAQEEATVQMQDAVAAAIEATIEKTRAEMEVETEKAVGEAQEKQAALLVGKVKAAVASAVAPLEQSRMATQKAVADLTQQLEEAQRATMVAEKDAELWQQYLGPGVADRSIEVSLRSLTRQ
jgi:hypothetical protein